MAVNSRELAGSLTAVKGGKVFRPETAGNFKEAVFRLGLFLAKIWGWALNYAFLGRDDYVIPNLSTHMHTGIVKHPYAWNCHGNHVIYEKPPSMKSL